MHNFLFIVVGLLLVVDNFTSVFGENVSQTHEFIGYSYIFKLHKMIYSIFIISKDITINLVHRQIT